MKIAIGADHRGYEYKQCIKQEIKEIKQPIEWIDVGAFDTHRSDYPIFARDVCQVMLRGDAQLGILICGSGIGMAVTANRFKKIYAGVVWNEKIAQLSREHDNTNVLVIPSDFVSCDLAIAMVRSWLDAEFRGGRYQERIDMIDAI